MKLHRHSHKKLLPTILVPSPLAYAGRWLERAGVRQSGLFGLPLVGVELYLLLCLLLTACTKADIHYPVSDVDEGLVRIYPDPCGYPLPALQYYFYNADAQWTCVVRRSDMSGNFEGALLIGNYQVVATNTNARNVEFIDMDDYRRAAIRIPVLETRPVSGRNASADLIYLAQPDTVYSVVIDNLPVTAVDTVYREPVAVLLTKRLNLVFTLQGDWVSGVSALNGVLYGVYPSLSLWSRTCAESEIAPRPDTVVGFGTDGQGGQRKVQIDVLGIYDPDYGRTYTNRLSMELLVSDGKREDFTVDLTDVLSDAISWNQGAMPEELTVHIEIRRVGVAIEGVVAGWISQGGAEIEI